MKAHHGSGSGLGLAMVGMASILMLGCCIHVNGRWEQAKSQRTVDLSSSLEPDATIEAATDDGSITVTGQEANGCQGSATITAYASTPERAQQLAEQTRVELVPTGQGLKMVPTLPARSSHEWIDISLQLTVPRRTSAELRSGDGHIHVEDLTGSVKANTGDGAITVRRITGPVELHTSDGSVECTSIEGLKLYVRTSDGAVQVANSHCQQGDIETGDGRIALDQIAVPRLRCHASDGSIAVRYAQEATRVVDVDLSTSDGSIELTCPPQVSAAVDARVGDGAIRTDLPVVVAGKIGNTLKGTLGKGEGRITLRTHDGSIHLR